MARLSQHELRSRLAFDWKVVRALKSPALGPVRGFVSADDVKRGNDATDADGDAGRVTIYVVEFRFPILIGPGPTTPSATCRFDLLAGGNYPFSTPSASFVSRPLPWSPHVHPWTGSVCLGDGWARARGKMLAAQLVGHVMRIVNCDEPDRGPFYDGWNGEAIRYWRNTLGKKPFHPELAYPVLPEEITHGYEDPKASFGAASEVGPTPTRTAAFTAAAESAFAFAPAPDTGFAVVSAPAFAPVAIVPSGDAGSFVPIGGAR